MFSKLKLILLKKKKNEGFTKMMYGSNIVSQVVMNSRI